MAPSADHSQLAKMLLAVFPIMAFYIAVANIYVIITLAAASSMILINIYLKNSRKKLNPSPLWVIPLLALARILLGYVVQTEFSMLIIYVTIILMAQKTGRLFSKSNISSAQTEALIATPIIVAMLSLYFSTPYISWSIAGPIAEPLFIAMIIKDDKHSKLFSSLLFLAGTIIGSLIALPPVTLAPSSIIFNTIKCQSSGTKMLTLAIFLDCIIRILVSLAVKTWNIATY